jgi:formiminoglutamase
VIATSINAGAFRWQGRVDDEDPGPSPRWHQRVRPFDAAADGGVALIGFAVDAGVSRNGGRPGAAQGPAALRSALANLPLLGEPALWDAGDVGCDGDALEAAQQELSRQVAQAIGQHCLPLVLGGGHEVAWGSYQGIATARPAGERLLIVNLDAHFDLRRATRGNSGTPFLQIHDHRRERGQPFDYRVYGISRYANTEALFRRADALGVGYRLDEALQTADGWAEAQHALAHDLAACDAVYLTLCLDVLPGATAPGVSAPAPLGVPLAFAERLVDQVMASGRVVAADIAELNPSHDRDGLTARVAARLAARIARGHAAAAPGLARSRAADPPPELRRPAAA